MGFDWPKHERGDALFYLTNTDIIAPNALASLRCSPNFNSPVSHHARDPSGAMHIRISTREDGPRGGYLSIGHIQRAVAETKGRAVGGLTRRQCKPTTPLRRKVVGVGCGVERSTRRVLCLMTKKYTRPVRMRMASERLA